MSRKHGSIFLSPKLFVGVMLFLLAGMAGSVSGQGYPWNPPGTGSGNPQAKAADAEPDWIVATINGDPKYNMGFNWRSTASDQKVQLAVGSCEVDACFEASGLSFDANATETGNYQKVKAEGLSPDTKYSYRVGTDGYWSRVGTFTTAPEGKSGFSFLYTTDPQSGDTTQFKQAGRTANVALEHFKTNKKHPSFWMMTGDHIDDMVGYPNPTSSNVAGEWNAYFTTGQEEVFKEIPYAPIMGNHDVFNISQYNIIDIFNIETTSFTLRSNSKEGSKGGANYAFLYGDVLFFALDLEGDAGNATITPAYVNQLKTWMQAAIDKYDHKWRIAFSHRGVHSGGTHPAAHEMQMTYAELGIDLGMHGHSHTYEVLGPVSKENGTQLVSPLADYVSDRDQTSNNECYGDSRTGYCGGTYNVDKGTMYFLGNRSGYKGGYTYRGTNPNIETGFVPSGSAPHPGFTVVDVTENNITLTTYLVDGDGAVTPYDEFTITKDSREPQTVTVIPGLKIVPDEIEFNPNTYTISGDIDNFPILPFDIIDYVIVSGQGGKAVSEWKAHKNNDPNVAAISSIGLVTLLKAGTVKFTAAIEGDDVYQNATVEITLAVTDASAPVPVPGTVVFQNGDDWYYYGTSSTTQLSDAFQWPAAMTWGTLKTPIGFGNPASTAKTNYGTIPDNSPYGPTKRRDNSGGNLYTWTYLKRSFNLPSSFKVDDVKGVTFSHVIDDGFVLHINGVDVYRLGLGSVGSGDYLSSTPTHVSTASTTNITGANLTTLTNAIKAALKPGENVITAVVGQNGGSSSDLHFDINLTINYESILPTPKIDIATATIEPPADLVYNGFAKVPVVKHGKKTLVEGIDYTIAYSRGGDNVNAGSVEFTITAVEGSKYTGSNGGSFTIAKAAPEYVVPTNLAATYGQTLADVALPDGWSWVSALTTLVGDAGLQKHKAKFTPGDVANYNVISSVDLMIDVSKTPEQIAREACESAGNTWTANGCKTPEEIAREACESAGNTWTANGCKTPEEIAQAACELAGNTWTANGCKTPEEIAQAACESAGNTWTANGCKTPEEIAQAACESAGNTWTADGCKTPEEIAQAACELAGNTWSNGSCKSIGTFVSIPAISAIYSVGLTLASVQLPPEYAWKTSTTALNAGNDQPFGVTYTANANTLPIDGTVIVNVAKADTDFGTPAVEAVTYTTTLTLAGVTLPEGYTWDAPATALTVANSGTAYAATRVAANGNYNDAAGTVAVTVNKAAGTEVVGYADPTVSQSVPVGSVLADVSLPEGWSWVDGTQVISTNGVSIFKARFTPADIANYNVVYDIDVEVGGYTSATSDDRIVPNVTTEGVSMIAPVVETSSEFTFGPNPVSRSAGKVAIYRVGKRVESGTLSIYDVSGNVVRKVSISDRAVGGLSRREVGSWDLKDAAGRFVAEGTYLLRGAVKVNGRRELVSVMIGVR